MSETKTERSSIMQSKVHAVCPYFGMFPEGFASRQIKTFTKEGDFVLDPFSGRGTTLLQALLMGRKAIAVDINPVAYCVSGAKAQVPSLDVVLSELRKLEIRYQKFGRRTLDNERRNLPPFFSRAFYSTTLREILFLRRNLNWHRDSVQRFITALVLGSLHGEMDRSSAYFSNQMPRTISTKPAY